jgi:ATP-binding cassette subfamily C protein
LRLRSGVSRDGTKASNILKAARHYGLSAKGFRKEPKNSTRSRSRRSSTGTSTTSSSSKASAGKVRAYQRPGLGQRKVSLEEFSESFTGVVLAMEPTEEFTRGGAPPALISALWERLHGSGTCVPWCC